MLLLLGRLKPVEHSHTGVQGKPLLPEVLREGYR